MEKKMIDQSELAKSVSEKINYEFIDQILVKPLDPIKVKKEFKKPVSNNTPKKDANGVEAIDYDNVETEVKEVDADFRKGIVLKIPDYLKRMYSKHEDNSNEPHRVEIKVGDVVVFRESRAYYFDLCKDAMLLDYYSVIAIEK